MELYNSLKDYWIIFIALILVLTMMFILIRMNWSTGLLKANFKITGNSIVVHLANGTRQHFTNFKLIDENVLKQLIVDGNNDIDFLKTLFTGEVLALDKVVINIIKDFYYDAINKPFLCLEVNNNTLETIVFSHDGKDYSDITLASPLKYNSTFNAIIFDIPPGAEIRIIFKFTAITTEPV